jgi:hypothetical protein
MHWDAVSAYGNPYVKTPAVDRIIADGCNFRASYSANPVSVYKGSATVFHSSTKFGFFDKLCIQISSFRIAATNPASRLTRRRCLLKQ